MLLIEKTISVPYSKANCFEAMRSCLNSLEKFEIREANELAGTFDVNVRASMGSYGELVSISMYEDREYCSITVTSSPKMPYLLWKNQNTKNVSTIIQVFTNEIKEYPQEPEFSESPNVADRLTELKKLYDSGLITEDEYNSKRAKILAEI